MEPEKTSYCICKSKDDKRFMICCDSCNTWFHGDCVNLKSEEARKIKHYYCAHCCTRKSLSIEYKQKISTPAHSESENEVIKKRSKKDCGNCIGCFRTEDCGRCDVCKTNKAMEHGSDAAPRIKAKCRLRQCVNADVSVNKLPVKKKEIPKINKELSSRAVTGAKLKNVSKKKPTSTTASHLPSLYNRSNKSSVKSADVERRRQSESADVERPSALEIVGATRAGTRAFKSFMAEAGVLPLDGTDDRVVVPGGGDDVLRQCDGPGCVLPARRNSKYCSDETCGLRLARARLMEILPGRIQQWKATPCVAEEFEKQRLQHIEKQMEKAREKLNDLADDEEKLNKWLDAAKDVKWDGEQETENDEEEFNSVYCPTCGHETSVKTALRHITRCFNKYENQTSFGSSNRTLNNVYNLFCDTYNKNSRTYCKRLRVICPEHLKEPKVEDEDICAYPMSQNLTDKMNDFDAASCCKAQKKACTKHYKWEKMRRALIDAERLAQLLRIDELYDEQRALKAASNARGAVLALLLHETVKHDESCAPSAPMTSSSASAASNVDPPPAAVSTSMTSSFSLSTTSIALAAVPAPMTSSSSRSSASAALTADPSAAVTVPMTSSLSSISPTAILVRVPDSASTATSLTDFAAKGTTSALVDDSTDNNLPSGDVV